MVAPFEKIFGDTDELRINEFLLSTDGLEFNEMEISSIVRVSRESIIPILQKLMVWGVLSRSRDTNKYLINQESKFIGIFRNLNNCIIDRMIELGVARWD